MGRVSIYPHEVESTSMSDGTTQAAMPRGGGELHRAFVPAGMVVKVSDRGQILSFGSFAVDPTGSLVIEAGGELVVL